jgi:hypothetical protein
MNWKYLLFDIFKVALPLAAAWLLPEGAPQVEIIASLLYLLSLVLGVDAVKKTVTAMKKAA